MNTQIWDKICEQKSTINHYNCLIYISYQGLGRWEKIIDRYNLISLAISGQIDKMIFGFHYRINLRLSFEQILIKITSLFVWIPTKFNVFLKYVWFKEKQKQQQKRPPKYLWYLIAQCTELSHACALRIQHTPGISHMVHALLVCVLRKSRYQYFPSVNCVSKCRLQNMHHFECLSHFCLQWKLSLIKPNDSIYVT